MITMKQMLEAGAHFGHQTKRWNPKMKPYIFGARNGIYIIDLQKTQTLFKKARQAMVEIAAEGGEVLFIGTKKQAADIVVEEAARCNMHYVNQRWLGGTMTNFVTIRKSIQRLKDLQEMREKGIWAGVTKKEQLGLQKELVKLEAALGGLAKLEKPPAAIYIVDPRRETIAVHEANKLNIPVFAVTDTNCDPEPIDYVIPSNDDAIRAIKLFSHEIADAILEGKQVFEENIRQRAAREKAAAKRPTPSKPADADRGEVDDKPPVGVAIEVKRGRRAAADQGVAKDADDDEKPEAAEEEIGGEDLTQDEN